MSKWRLAVLTLILATAGFLPIQALAFPGFGGPDSDVYDGRTFGDGTTPLDDPGHLEDLFNGILNWVAQLMDMSQTLTATMMDQITIVGAMLDAKDQLETQLLFDRMAAEAHRDYQSDITMCTFGTNVRSLAATQQKMEINTRAFDLIMLKRDTGSQDMLGSVGREDDVTSRFQNFKRIYCDSADASGYLGDVCEPGIDPNRINKDVDYTHTIDSRYTLDADFINFTGSPDENDVVALTRNLFAYYPFQQIPSHTMTQVYAKDQYQDERSVDAIRSVATNSFAHIVGMRTAGSDKGDVVTPFMQIVLQQLWYPQDNVDINLFLGQTPDSITNPNPSYYAQMEILTHKLFEGPGFYTSLYTSPENVERIGATLQALKLMQDRDRFESSLRREMLVSMILELAIRDRQDSVVNTSVTTVNDMVTNPN